MKKALAFILACLMLIPLFAACSGSGNDPADSGSKSGDGTTEAPETADPTILFPGMDWDGRVFGVLGIPNGPTYFGNMELWAEGYTGEAVNDAIYERNTTIEEMYNVEISVFQERNDTNTVLRDVVRSFSPDFDLAFLRQTFCGGMASEGMMYDLLTLGYADYNQPYWNRNAIDTLMLGGRVFFTTSDYELHDKIRTYIIVYNADMAENFSLGDLQTIAEEGKWTIDKMTECAQQVAQDINGDGAMNAEDRFGLICGDGKDFQFYTHGMGNLIATKDENGRPYICMNTEHMNLAIDKALKLVDKKMTAFPQTDLGRYGGYDYAYDIFYNGHSLFYSDDMITLKSCAERCNFSYKVLPFPKYDEDQPNYISQPDNIGSFFCVPASAEDSDFCGFMLEVLSEISSRTTLPTFYEESCKHRYSYDERSAKMLDTIMNGIVYDIGYVYDFGALPSILGSDIVGKRQNVLARKYAIYARNAEEEIDDLMKLMASYE